MNDEQFNTLQNEIKNLAAQIANNQKQQFEWTKALNQNQIRIESIVNEKKKPEKWMPYYFDNADPGPEYPEIFNKYGEKMEMFFISDRNSISPNSKDSRYLIFDRYNYGLDTQVYINGEMFHIVGKPKRRLAMLTEPTGIIPNIYSLVLQNKEYIENNFDAIFTYNTAVLQNLKNAKFFLAGYVIYGKGMPGMCKSDFKVRDDNYKYKTKNISMICSAKEMCEGHLRRKKLAFKVKNEKLADTFGRFDGGGLLPY